VSTEITDAITAANLRLQYVEHAEYGNAAIVLIWREDIDMRGKYAQGYVVGRFDFWIFRIFNILQPNLDWLNNKVEKAFFLIFMSSCLEINLMGAQIDL
jgi:hypothetical protein